MGAANDGTLPPARLPLRCGAGGRARCRSLPVLAVVPPAAPGAVAGRRAADGGGLHARLPRAAARRRPAEPRLPPPLRPRLPLGAGRRVLRCSAPASAPSGPSATCSTSAWRSAPGRCCGRGAPGWRPPAARSPPSIVIPPSGLSALAWVGAVALGLWSIRAGGRGARGGGAGEPAPDPPAVDRPGCSAAPRSSTGSTSWSRWSRRWASSCGSSPGRDRRRLVVASLVGVSPYLVHLATAGPGNVVQGMVIEPVFDLRGGRGPAAPARTVTTTTASSSGPGPSTNRRGRSRPRRARSSSASGSSSCSVACGAAARGPAGGAHRDGRTRLLVMAAFAPGCSPRPCSGPTPPTWPGSAASPSRFLPAAVVELLAAPRRPSPAPSRRGRRRARAAARRGRSRTSPCAPTPRRSGQTFGYRRNALSHGARGPRVPLRAAATPSRPSTRSSRWSTSSPSPATGCSSGPATSARRPTARRSSTTCSPTSTRRPATSRWTPAWPTPTTPGWPTSSARPTW